MSEGRVFCSGHILILLTDELLGHLDLLWSAADVEEFLAGVGLGAAVQFHVCPRLHLYLPDGVPP